MSRNGPAHFIPSRWLKRLWLTFVATTIAAVLLLGLYNWEQVREHTTGNLRILAAAVANGMQSKLNALRLSMALLAYRLVTPEGHTQAPPQGLLSGFLNEHPLFGSIGVVTLDGRVVAFAGRPLGLPLRGLEAYPQILAAVRQCLHTQQFCIAPPVPATGPHWFLPLFWPMANGAVLLGQLPIDEQGTFWRDLALPVGAAVYLLRDDGFLEARFPVPAKTGYAQMQDGIATRYLRAHPTARGGVYEGLVSADGTWRLGAVYHLDDYPMAAGVSIPRSTLWADWWQAMVQPLVAAFALLFLSTAAYPYLRRLSLERENVQRRLWAEKERAVVTLASIGDGVIATDVDGRITDMNPTAEQLTGFTREEALGRPLGPIFRIVNEQRRTPVESPVARVLQTGRVVGLANHTVLIAKDGSEHAIEDTAAPIRGESGELLGVVLVFHDATEKRRMAAQMVYLATHDALTGLPNRALLLDRIGHGMAQADRNGELFAVALLDLDGFKEINDRLGHAAGDALLREVSRRLSACCRASDTVARLGGDEFVLVLAQFRHLDDITALLERVLETLAAPFTVKEEHALVSASMGVTVYPLDEADPETLLRHADLAMYQAKAVGRNRYHFFDAELDGAIQSQHELRERLAAALERGEFLLHYQPQVHMRSGTLTGVEALLRWMDPERGLRAPGEFLPAIAGTRTMESVDRWVLAEAVAQARRWEAAGHPLPVSVNLSSAYLTNPRFLEDLGVLVRQNSLPAGLLEMEILESIDGDALDHLEAVFAACRELGVGIALDDFGTGASSLIHLQRIPAQTIKIDQRFIRCLFDTPENISIVEAVCTFARMAGRRVVAEGVESTDLGDALLRLGCEYAQGYAIARPMPAEAISAWGETWTPPPQWREAPRVLLTATDMLYFEYEHRRWVPVLQSLCLGHGREIMPEPEGPDQCRFGTWFAGTDQRLYGGFPALRILEENHRRLHAIGAAAAETARSGHVDPAVAQELGAAHEAFVQSLADLVESSPLLGSGRFS